MSTNYQKISLVLIYDGQPYEILTAPLTELDKLTSKHITKYQLLKYVKDNIEIDKNTSKIFENIIEKFEDEMLLDDEIKIFDFILVSKETEKSQKVFAVNYNDNDIKLSAKDLECNQNLIKILKLYNEKINDNNIDSIIKQIEQEQKVIKESKILDEVCFFEILEKEKEQGKWLEENEYEYYKKLKTGLLSLKSRNKLISDFIISTQSKYSRARLLHMIKKYFSGELSKTSSSIIEAKTNNLNSLKDSIYSNTLVEKNGKTLK